VVHGGRLPRVRVVGAQHELADAHLGGQVAQRFRREDQRVVVQLAQILRRCFLQTDAGVHLRMNAKGIVRARGV
jgi:hypothetical protein